MTYPLAITTLLCVLGISCGQLMFRLAAQNISTFTAWQQWLFNGWLWVALVLYASTTLGWLWILRQAPLHLAYPFMALAFVLVPTLAWLLLGEPMHWRTLAGGIVIMAGVALASTA